jgi:hypothetical protein
LYPNESGFIVCPSHGKKIPYNRLFLTRDLYLFPFLTRDFFSIFDNTFIPSPRLLPSHFSISPKTSTNTGGKGRGDIEADWKVTTQGWTKRAERDRKTGGEDRERERRAN